MPGIGLGYRTRDAGRLPRPVVGVVNLPGLRILVVTLGPVDVLSIVYRVVYIELQRLRSRRVLDVVVELVAEVINAVIGAELFPPQCVGVGSAAAEEELGRAAVLGRAAHAPLHGVLGDRTAAVGAGAGATRLPAAHLVDVVER